MNPAALPHGCLRRAATPAFDFKCHNSVRRTPGLHDADRIAHPQVSAPERTSVTAAGIQVAGRVTLRHVASIRGQDRRVQYSMLLLLLARVCRRLLLAFLVYC